MSGITTVMSGGMAVTNAANLIYTAAKAATSTTVTVPKGDPYNVWHDPYFETHYNYETHYDPYTDQYYTDSYPYQDYHEGYWETKQDYETKKIAKNPEKNDGFFAGKVIPAVNVMFGGGSAVADGVDAAKALHKGDGEQLGIQGLKLLGDGLMIAGGVAALATGNVTVGYAATMLAGSVAKTAGEIATLVKEN